MNQIIKDKLAKSIKTKKLYGVGVGTGDPELLTLKALKTLQNVDVIAIPRSNPYSPSVAWRIVEPVLELKPKQIKLYLDFPMSKDPERVIPAWEKAINKLNEAFTEYDSIAFITEGDPLFYSTYIYLHKKAKEIWKDINIEVIPAVSSITAVASVSKIPIADGQEKVAILPASYGLETLPEILRLFDTILLMKVSSVMPQIVEILEKENLLQNAFYVSRATMEYEKIVYDLKEIQNDKCDYFSMVVIKKNENDGILFNKNI